MYDTETRYCNRCTEDTTHQLPYADEAPEAICEGCQRAA